MGTTDLREKLAGKFIVFDGPDGSGKGTQIKRLADALECQGLALTLPRDPGGTRIGEQIRSVLLDDDLSTMDVRCEALLFMASRAQLMGEIITPAIEAGNCVICDRFISATCAYQGAAGFDIDRVIELGRFAIDDAWPDLTIIVDVPAEVGFSRIQYEHDAMEARPIEYHQKVGDIFRSLPGRYPGLVEVVDGTGSVGEVHQQIVEILERVDF